MTLTLRNCSSDYLQQFLLFWWWKSLCWGTSCFSSSSHKGSWKIEAEPRSASPLQRSEWVTFQADEIMLLWFEEDRCEQMWNPVIQSAWCCSILQCSELLFVQTLCPCVLTSSFHQDFFVVVAQPFCWFCKYHNKESLINLRTHLLLTRPVNETVWQCNDSEADLDVMRLPVSDTWCMAQL